MEAAVRRAHDRTANWQWKDRPRQTTVKYTGCGITCAPVWRKIRQRLQRRRKRDQWCDASSNLSGWQSAHSIDSSPMGLRRKALLRLLGELGAPDDLVEDENSITTRDRGEGWTKASSSGSLPDEFSYDCTVLHEQRSWGPPGRSWSPTQPCVCGYERIHVLEFDPVIPIAFPPGVIPGTYREALFHARSICGNWVTILSRSQSLDPQMQHIGLGKLKRSVMNRIAIPFTAQMEENDTVLHSWIGTPLGPKHMHASLIGKEMTDVDREVGTWTGLAKMIDFSIPWFCSGKPVRAFQLLRRNPKFGEAYETRVVLPDREEGRIMLFNISLYPVEPEKAPIFVDRILKVVST